MSPEPIRHADTIIFPASLDPDAVSVVERLTQSGFESYLVGGCVRDLLCGMIPKDFDVSTAARPRQIRSRFRNCRVIGRRFKLAHVHFGDKIIEVATFRRTPEAERDDTPGDESESAPSAPSGADAEDLLITRDNVYGTAEEDVLRRDFTINALLYDVGPAEVIDYVGGVKDLNDRVLRTIGDPAVRLAEDPIRMLRAIRFRSRLDLTFAPDLDEAMRDAAPLIAKSAPPRVLEEIYRVMTCGKARHALPALIEYGLMRHLLPGIHEYWSEHPQQLEDYGAALDVIDHGARRVSNALLLALLFLEPWKAEHERGDGDLMAEANDLITPMARHMSVPRKDVGIAKQLLLLHFRLERNRRSRRVRLDDFVARPLTQEAISLLYASCLAGRTDPAVHAIWTRRVATLVPEPPPRGDDEPARPARKRKRRRRRGRSDRARGEEQGRSDRDPTAPREAREGTQPAASDQPDDARGRGRDRSRGRRRRPAAEGPARQDGEAAGAASTSAGGDTPATDPGTRPAKSPARETPGPRARQAPEAPPKSKGLRGWIRSIFGGSAASEAPSSPPAEAGGGPTPPRPPAPGAEDRPAASADTAGSAASSTPAAGRGGRESPAREGARGDKAGDKTGAASKSRRRRRRRSGRGSGRGSGREGERGTTDAGAAEAGGSSSDEGRGSQDGKSERSGSGRRGRGRRKGGGRNGGGSGASGSTSRDGGNRKSSSRKRSGGSKDRTRPDSKNKPSKGDSKPAPAHERPEEIEDLFDW